MDWFGQPLSEVPATFEVVKLIHPNRLTFTVDAWSLGYKVKHFGQPTQTREQVAIAITARLAHKPAEVRHWCIIGPEPVAILEPQLANHTTASAVFDVRAIGRTPSQRWSITRSPAPA